MFLNGVNVVVVVVVEFFGDVVYKIELSELFELIICDLFTKELRFY